MKVEYKINDNEIFFYGTIDIDDMKSNLKVFPEGDYHKGYLKQWLFIENKIIEELDKIKSDEIIIAGHSLGGGIARIGIVELANIFTDKKFKLKTYGTPRSYTWTHREILNDSKNIISVEEYINRGDLIPRIPPWFPFFWLLGAKRNNRIIQGKFNFNWIKSHNDY